MDILRVDDLQYTTSLKVSTSDDFQFSHSSFLFWNETFQQSIWNNVLTKMLLFIRYTSVGNVKFWREECHLLHGKALPRAAQNTAPADPKSRKPRKVVCIFYSQLMHLPAAIRQINANCTL